MSKPNFIDESSNIFNPPPQPPIYSCEFCGSNAQYGHYCTPQAPFNNPEPGYSQDLNFPQDIHDYQQQPKVLLLAWDRIFEIKDALGTKQYKPKDLQDLFRELSNDVQIIHEELAEYINTPGWNRPAFYDDDDDVDYTITITPVLSTEKPIDSLSIGDEHLDIIPAIESNELIKSSVEDLVPIPSEFKEEISSGSTTTHSDISLPNYEAFSFYNDHIKEINSGSTTTHSDISLSEYDSFIFDLTHEEFADELAHIISPPEYDCFYFWNLPDPGELISIFNFGIRENYSTTGVNLQIEDDHSPLLEYVVWIFLAHLTYPVIPPYLYPFGNEDTIFDPGITINRVYSFKPGLSHQYGAFKKFNTHRSHLNEWSMIINGKNIHILDVLLFHFYPP
uniref:Reverse transcriptase domain-containing protein n=1 Tax=Tanacetum cinerariifolium TaxID=118510 RepID=A0A699JZ56_TANCI|nr:hypothetical protein [Tanacetum cinerariifolium]